MKKLFALIIVLAVLVGGLYLYIQFTQSNIYQSSKEFEEFADKSLKERELFRANKNTTVDYDYNDFISVAVKKDSDSGERISEFRDKRVKETINECLLRILSDRSEDLTHACIIDTAVKYSGNGAVSLIVYQKMYEESGKEMELIDSSANTYMFDEETGKQIRPLQAMTITYENRVSKFAREYFRNVFSKDKFSEDWKDYIKPTDDNFKDFLMTGNSVIFYFQPGTVLDKSYGVIALKIPEQYMHAYIRPKVLDRFVDPNGPMVAITYDDGPGGASEERILKCLEKNNSVATFFYQGYRMDKFGYNAVKANEIGCEIGNHSWDHPAFTTLSKKKMDSQIDRTNAKIEQVAGVMPGLFRPPYGDYNKKVTSVTDSNGMSEVLWTLDTRDWESRDYKKIVKSIKNSKKLDGKIILMHSIYGDTAKATEKIVPWLQKNGYQTVTVSELIKYRTGKNPKSGKVYRTIN